MRIGRSDELFDGRTRPWCHRGPAAGEVSRPGGAGAPTALRHDGVRADPDLLAAAPGPRRPTGPPAMSVQPLLPAAVCDRLGEALRDRFGSVAVSEALGLAGEAALSRGDLSGADRLTRQGSDTETLIRLFLLGLPVPAAAAEAALRPLPLPLAEAAGLVERDGEQVRAMLDLRPYSEAGGPDWWVVSDLGAEVRPLQPEH